MNSERGKPRLMNPAAFTVPDRANVPTKPISGQLKLKPPCFNFWIARLQERQQQKDGDHDDRLQQHRAISQMCRGLHLRPVRTR